MAKEQSFETWYKRMSKANKLGSDPDDPRHQYDWRAYWRDNIKGRPDKNDFFGTAQDDHGGQRRFPDKYKTKDYDTEARDKKLEREVDDEWADLDNE